MMRSKQWLDDHHVHMEVMDLPPGRAALLLVSLGLVAVSRDLDAERSAVAVQHVVDKARVRCAGCTDGASEHRVRVRNT